MRYPKLIPERTSQINNPIYLLVLLIVGFLLIVSPTVAQERNGWSVPEIILQSEGHVPVGSMALVADAKGYLHWFYAHRPEEDMAAGIDYMWWDGDIWSEPNNIIMNPDGSSTSFLRAAIDAQQVVHLIWRGGGNALYYASASIVEAASPRAWSEPGILATFLGEPDITISNSGEIYVAYLDAGSNSIAVVASNDGGLTWSAPFRVASSSFGSLSIDVRIAVDTTERLHIAWTEAELPDGWPPTGAFYAQSLDGGLTWSQPLQVTGPGHGQIGVTAIGDNQVHLVWRSSIGGDGTFHQWSQDGGVTWSTPHQYSDRGGFSGLPSFAVDSTGTLYYAIGPAYVASWSEGDQGDYVDVATAQVRSQYRKSSGEMAVLAITSGNVVHVVFETDFRYLWHTWRRLDIPPLPTVTPHPVAGSSPQTELTPTSVVSSSDDYFSSPTPAIPVSVNETVEGMSSVTPLLIGSLPAVLIVFLVTWYSFSNKRKNK